MEQQKTLQMVTSFFQINSSIKSIKMRTVIKTSNHLNTRIQDSVIINKRIIGIYNTSEGIWKGVNRYAH